MSNFRKGAGTSVEGLCRGHFFHRFSLFLAIALLAPLAMLKAQTYEGNASANAIEGTAVVEACSGCLNGTRVGNIGNGNANYLRIKGISVATTGSYTVTLFYTMGSDGGSRSFTLQINNGTGPTLSGLTGTSWTTPKTTTFSANFTAGSTNSVGFFNATGPAPNVDHIVVSGGSSSGGGGGGTGGGTTLTNVLVTLYGWPDNSPPGNAIAYPGLHSVATQGQTFSNPGTFATDALSNGEMTPGTKVYDAHFQKYFILEDECVQCETDWASKKRHIDLWIGGNPPANDTDVINCEDNLTLDGQTIIENPPSTEAVNTTPLYNSNTNACF